MKKLLVSATAIALMATAGSAFAAKKTADELAAAICGNNGKGNGGEILTDLLPFGNPAGAVQMPNGQWCTKNVPAGEGDDVDPN
jgi:hypothetical protein